MLEKISINKSADSIKILNQYLKVGQLNDHMLNIIISENRILEFHIHEDSDEMFYIIEGNMQLEFDNELINLNAGDFIIVPKGTRHRPVVKDRVKILLIEKDGTLNKDNTGGAYK